MNRFLFFLFTSCILSNSHSQSANIKNWIQDLDFYRANLEKNHIDLYNTVSKVDFDKNIESIQSSLHKKSDIEIFVDLMRLTRKIGDGHTAISLRNIRKHFYPIEVFKVNGQWRVIKTAKQHQNLLGKIITKIDNKSINEIEKEISEVAQYVENEQSKTFRTGQYLIISELLYGLQLTKNKLKAEFLFIDDENKKSKIMLNAIDDTTFYEKTEFEQFNVVTPEIQKPTNSKFDFLWFSPIKNTEGVYIKFESYPSFEDMETFGASLLNYIHTNQTKQLVIDLRNNGGGDFFVGTFLAYYLNLADSVDWKSGVYVLTDRVTFSAGTSNASQFRQILNAKIIGESTGSNPTGYQDMGQFVLPNSKLTVTYSKRLFRFQDHVTQGVQPDVFITYNWESYAKGIDTMMEWVIQQIKNKT